MPILALFAPLFNWLLRTAILKFVVLGALFAVLSLVMPLVEGLVTPFLSVQSAFSAITANVWYWLNFFQVGFGFNLCVSAYIARFLIRRIPVIG